MVRTSAVLLALLLIAACPTRAQQSTPLRAAPAPLPALLRPTADAGRSINVAGPANDVQRGMLIGAGVGCVVMGAFLGLTVDDNDVEGARLQNTLLGCGFGAFVGTVFGFVFTAGPSISKRR